MECVARSFWILFISSVLCSVIALEKNVNSTENFEASGNDSLHHLVDCEIIKLETGDYKLLPNGSLEVPAYNLVLNGTYFDLTNHSVSICKPPKTWQDVYALIVIYHLISIYSFFIVVFLVRKLRWKHILPVTYLMLLAFLCSTIYYGLLSLMIGSDKMPDYLFPQAVHVFAMSFFFWTSVWAYGFSATYEHRRLRAEIDLKDAKTELLRRRIKIEAMHYSVNAALGNLYVKGLVLSFFTLFMDCIILSTPEVLLFHVDNLIMCSYFPIYFTYSVVGLWNFCTIQSSSIRKPGYLNKLLKKIHLINYALFAIMSTCWGLENYFEYRNLRPFRISIIIIEALILLCMLAAMPSMDSHVNKIFQTSWKEYLSDYKLRDNPSKESDSAKAEDKHRSLPLVTSDV